MKRIYYVTRGHSVINGRGTGAQGILDEAVEAASLAQDLNRALLDAGYESYNDPPHWDLTRVWKWLRKWIKPTDVMVDIHFNAGPPAANGIEVYIPKVYSGDELTLAMRIATGLHAAMGIRLRMGRLGIPGVKLENESQHNTLRLLGGLGIGIRVLVEVCYCTNQNDVDSFKQNRPKVLWALKSAILGVDESS